jgi:two-component system response regulator MprA
MPGERILVVDDDERLAASLRRSLEYAGYRVGVAPDGPRALTMAGQDRPDLVVLDVLLPELDGYGVCRALRAAGAQGAGPMVLMLTARDAVPDRVAGLDAGADDYLVKPFEHDELLARVRALLRRRPAPAQATVPVPLTLADLTLDPGTREVRRGERQVELTALEFDLLHQFLRHSRQVLTRAQLMDAVWGGGSPLTSNVVDVYVGYLRTKLEAAGETRLLHTVRGVGYALRA